MLFYKLRKRLKLKILILIPLLLLGVLYYHSKNSNITEYHDEFISVQFINDNDEEKISETLEQNRIINLTNFQFTINSNLCEESSSELLGIILVTSYVGHDQLRSAHRHAISQNDLRDLGLLRVFLLAEIPNSERFINQKQIENENSKFKDLIQGNFQESYRNLTYKHLMGYKWIIERCKNVKFVIKLDDDIVFDIFYLSKFLKYFSPPHDKFLAGYILSNQKTIRNQASKWFVPEKEYALNIYPDYLSGWLYITNPETCKIILLKSQNENFFWIDDTFVTGIIREKLNIPLIKFNEWYSANSQFLECCIKDSINFNYVCDYYIGPNGGDTKLVINFMKQIQKCYLKQKLCKTRPESKSLKKTCVAEAKNLLERDHGEAFVHAIKL